MKHLYWKDRLRYTRPDNHPDVAEWRRTIEYQKQHFGSSLYRIIVGGYDGN